MQDEQTNPPKHFIAGVVLDQDVSRFINLLQLSLPEIQSVAVVLGPESARLLPELEVAVAKQGWQLNAHILTAQDQPLRVLNQLYANSDVMLVLPDRAVFNQRLAKLVIALSTRHRVPVMAYSKAYTQVGALFSVYSTPDKIGQQTARIAIQYLDGKLNKKGQILTPEGFGISINRSVERVLKTGIKDEQALSTELQKREIEEKLK